MKLKALKRVLEVIAAAITVATGSIDLAKAVRKWRERRPKAIAKRAVKRVTTIRRSRK